MANAKRLGDFIDRDNRRIALASLKPAQVLLREARLLGERFLRHAEAVTYALDIATDKPAHVHQRTTAQRRPAVYLL
jgi:hypothetical protein